MNNIIYYYYNVKPEKINNIKNNYYFYLGGNLYYFLIYNNNHTIEDVYDLASSVMSNNIHLIIKNNKNSIITLVDNIPYILLRINLKLPKSISINEIDYFSKLNFQFKSSMKRNHWNILWSAKIDYLENQIYQIGRKYPVLVDSFSYFVGMAENAISYYKNTIDSYQNQNMNHCLSHDKLILNSLDFFNPLNLTIDHKARDVGEYIKLSFFNQNYSIFQELDSYFKNNFYSEFDMRVLISRVLYPSFYFNLYDSVVNKVLKEEEITRVTGNIDEYENYLKDILRYFDKYYRLPTIEWLA